MEDECQRIFMMAHRGDDKRTGLNSQGIVMKGTIPKANVTYIDYKRSKYKQGNCGAILKKTLFSY